MANKGMTETLPYGRQCINDADTAAVIDALASQWLTTGPKVSEFEQMLAERIGCRHVVAVSNGTAALHLAMLATGIGSGDRVLTSPNTFVASANCAAYVGATPDFVDIDPVSYCLSPKQLEKAWTGDTKAVVAVDYAGQSADLPEISRIARQRGAIVIEDACHAVGGSFFHDQRVWSVGGHPWADVSTFSFHPVKSLTTGEGGALATNNSQIADRARLLRSHGIVRDPAGFVGPLEGREEIGPWYYEMHELGFNYRITDFQCALGLSQLARLDSFIERRREIVATYNEAFSELDFVQIPQLRDPRDRPLISWHLYTLRIDFRRLGISRVQLMRQLLDQGVGSQVLYIPVHLHPYYRRQYGYGEGKCPEAEAFYAEALSLPLFPTLTDKDVARVIRVFKDSIR